MTLDTQGSIIVMFNWIRQYLHFQSPATQELDLVQLRPDKFLFPACSAALKWTDSVNAALQTFFLLFTFNLGLNSCCTRENYLSQD